MLGAGPTTLPASSGPAGSVVGQGDAHAAHEGSAAAAGVLPEGEPEALVGAEATAGAAADADVRLDADIDPTDPAAAPEGLLEEDADGEGADGGEQ